MDVKDIEALKKAYPILASKIEVNFPTNSFSNINKILDFLKNEPKIEKFVRDLIALNINNKKEDMHYMTINNVNDLKKAYPQLVNEIISDALSEERNYQIGKSNEIRQSTYAANKVAENIANGANGSSRRGRK